MLEDPRKENYPSGMLGKALRYTASLITRVMKTEALIITILTHRLDWQKLKSLLPLSAEEGIEQK